MRLLKRLTIWVVVYLSLVASGLSQIIGLVNNHDFALRSPVELINFPMPQGQWLAGDTPVQVDGSNLVFVAQIAAKSRKELALQQARVEQPVRALTVEATEVGIQLHYGAVALGELSWDIIVEELSKKGKPPR